MPIATNAVFRDELTTRLYRNMFGLSLKIGAILLSFAMQDNCLQKAETKPKNEPKMENTEVKNLPKLEASITLQDKVLHVEYKLKNTTGKTIYLFNVLWEHDNQGKPLSAPQPVYACLRDNKTLLLGKQIPPLPLLKSVELRRIPFVTKIEANQDFSEKFDIPVPVEEYNPYFPKTQQSSVENRRAESVVFTIQFIREIEGLKVKPAQIGNAFTIWHQNIFGNLETISTNPKPIAVQVNYRTDTFERF